MLGAGFAPARAQPFPTASLSAARAVWQARAVYGAAAEGGAQAQPQLQPPRFAPRRGGGALQGAGMAALGGSAAAAAAAFAASGARGGWGKPRTGLQLQRLGPRGQQL